VSSRDEEYEQKIRYSTEPAVVTFVSPLDDKSKAIASEIEKLSNEFTTVKFYQVDVRRHTMLHRAYTSKELPAIVFVKNGADFLILDEDASLPNIRKGLQALQVASE
jgi:thioredoxin 1